MTKVPVILSRVKHAGTGVCNGPARLPRASLPPRRAFPARGRPGMAGTPRHPAPLAAPAAGAADG